VKEESANIELKRSESGGGGGPHKKNPHWWCREPEKRGVKSLFRVTSRWGEFSLVKKKIWKDLELKALPCAEKSGGKEERGVYLL